MKQTDSLDILPSASLAQRRWDYLCAAILIVPLVLLAFQGDILFGIAERTDYHGWYTEIHATESKLAEIEAELDRLNDEKRAITAAATEPGARRRIAELRAREAELKQTSAELEIEIDALRQPLEQAAAKWNFSFVRRWPVLLLVGPLAIAVLWFAVPARERRSMYDEALDSGARTRGLWLGLLAVAVFALGAWGQNALSAHRLANQGVADYIAPWYLRGAVVVTYLSMAGWTAAIVHAFAGRRGLLRVWLPLMVIMALVILNFSHRWGRWVGLWDTSDEWGYAYAIGPVAAMLFYFLLEEHGPYAETDPDSRRPLRAAWPLIGGGLGVVGLYAGVWLLARTIGRQFLLSELKWYPIGVAAALATLGIWQVVDQQRHGRAALRLGGVAILVGSLLFRAEAVGLDVRYLEEIALPAALLGAALAVFGWELFRRAWVPIVLLGLAIPWPDRAYVDFAGPLQRLAAEASVGLVDVVRKLGVVDWLISNEGTRIIVGPLPGDELVVADQCSGLKILLAFVALSVVYAFMNPRPIWRRVVVLASAVPIALACNILRVFVMVVVYRMGYREIAADGLQHEAVGYAMLPVAFGMLYLEMRFLDLFVIAFGREEEPPAQADAGESAAASAAHSDDALERPGPADEAPWRTSRSTAFVLATALLLVVAGAGLRIQTGQETGPGIKVSVRRNLSELPMDLLGYEWRRQRLDENIEKKTGADVYVKRYGYRKSDGSVAQFYVTFVGDVKRELVEHEPQVCMRAAGWDQPWTEAQQIKLDMPADRGDLPAEFPVNVFLFRQDVNYTLMLNVYSVNGRYTPYRDQIRSWAKDADIGYYSQVRVWSSLTYAEVARLNPETIRDLPKFQRLAEILKEVVIRVNRSYLPKIGQTTTEEPTGEPTP